MSSVDIVISAIILISLLIGYKKGFILTLFSMGSFIVAAVLTKLYHRDAAQWIVSNTSLVEVIKNTLLKNIPYTDQNIIKDGLYSSDSSTKLFNWVNEYLSKETMQFNAMEAMDIVKEEMVNKTTHLIITIISIITLFIVIRILITLIGHLINSIFSLPGLDAINKMAGLVLGGLRGILIAALLLILMLPSAMASPEGWVANLINSSYLIQFFLNHVSIYLLEWFL